MEVGKHRYPCLMRRNTGIIQRGIQLDLMIVVKALLAYLQEEKKKAIWPKLLISLSSKEKEEDFMAMKGCKPPQRPMKSKDGSVSLHMCVNMGLDGRKSVKHLPSCRTNTAVPHRCSIVKSLHTLNSKKRAKLIQITILLVSPGSWLTDLCQERYEVREEKTSKKKPRGLKAMVSLDSDSE